MDNPSPFCSVRSLPAKCLCIPQASQNVLPLAPAPQSFLSEFSLLKTTASNEGCECLSRATQEGACGMNRESRFHWSSQICRPGWESLWPLARCSNHPGQICADFQPGDKCSVPHLDQTLFVFGNSVYVWFVKKKKIPTPLKNDSN